MSPQSYRPVGHSSPVDEGPSTVRPISPGLWRQQARPRSSFEERPRTFKDRIVRDAGRIQRNFHWTYKRLSPVQRILVGVAGLIALVLGILFLIYNERIFGWLSPYARKWRDLRAGWLILWFLTVAVAFPPLVGYSSFVSAAGFVYGFPNGWFIASTATVCGSTLAFLASRSILRQTVERLVAADRRFAALSTTIKHDGLKLLIMIRLCPLPFSLSNGALATIPTVHWSSFALATAAASPKLLVHVFIGAKLAEIAENGGTMDAKTKAISYMSIVIGSIAGIATGLVIYRQTKARAQQLESEEQVQPAEEAPMSPEYFDDPDVDGFDEPLRQEQDDISLHPGVEHTTSPEESPTLR